MHLSCMLLMTIIFYKKLMLIYQLICPAVKNLFLCTFRITILIKVTFKWEIIMFQITRNLIIVGTD